MPQERQRGMRAVRTAGRALAVILALAGSLATSAVGGTVAAQDMATPAATGMALGVPTVSVSGHGSVNVPPDTASVSIGVDVIKPTLGEAQEQATTQATAIIEAFEAAGIAEEDIQTDFYSVNILRDYSENADPTEITGFEIVNQLRVTVRDTDQLGELLDAAVNAGANSIYGVTFYVDDQTEAASDARSRSGRRRADEGRRAGLGGRHDPRSRGRHLGRDLTAHLPGLRHGAWRAAWAWPRRPCQSSPARPQSPST